jgi:hypothetical protein
LVIRFLIFRELIEYFYCCEKVGQDRVENEHKKREHLHEHEGLGLARLLLPLLPMFLGLFLISSAPEDSAASLVKLTGVSREEHFEQIKRIHFVFLVEVLLLLVVLLTKFVFTTIFIVKLFLLSVF